MRPTDGFDLNSLPSPSHGGSNGKTMDVVGALRVMASDQAGRVALANLAGITFGGKRDLFSALGYQRTLVTKDYRDRYLRGDISARIVEAYPKSTWHGGTELVEDEEPDVETDFEEAFEELNKRLHIWTMMFRADILAGLGRYATLLIGAPGKLEEEMPQMKGPDDLLYLAPYAEDESTIERLVEDSEDPRFGQPLYYVLKRSGLTTGGSKRMLDRRVHWTRVLHVADGILDQTIYGTPRLERVWNRLDDLDKVMGGGSEAFWLRVHQGTLLKVNPDIKVGEGEIAKLQEETDDFVNGIRRFLTLRGVDVDQLGTDVSNFGPQVASLISIISGATGIPQRLLLGSERGELASTQDKLNWDERVSDRRIEYAEPLVREFVDRLIKYGALPKPTEYNVRWPEIDELDDKEKAGVAESWSKLNKQAGGVVVTPEEIRDRVLRLPKLDPALAKKTPVPQPASPPGQGQRPDQQAETDETTVKAE